MMKYVSGAILAFAMVSGAQAAPDLSKVRCEDPEIIEIIKEALAKAKFENGQHLSTILGDNSKLTAKTISASKDRFSCKVTLNISYNGETQQVRTTYSFRIVGEKAVVTLEPFY